MATLPKSREIKLVLLGCAGVGKSSLFLRLVKNEFNPTQETTMGAAFKYVYVLENRDGSLELASPSADGNLWRVGVWDTAGQERYEALGPMYYRGADVAVVVMDNSRMGIEAAKAMVTKLRRDWGTDARPICVVQNKSDLPDFKYDKETIDDLHVDFACSASALYGENVVEAFMEACKLAVVARKKKLVGETTSSPSADLTHDAGSAMCCGLA